MQKVNRIYNSYLWCNTQAKSYKMIQNQLQQKANYFRRWKIYFPCKKKSNELFCKDSKKNVISLETQP